MAGEPNESVPEGAAVLPLIPEALGVHPLLLAVLHAVVFLEGSEDDVLNADAAAEAMEYVATYLQRLGGPERQRLREDLVCLAAYAKQQQWPKQQVRFFKEFLDSYGIREEGET